MVKINKVVYFRIYADILIGFWTNSILKNINDIIVHILENDITKT